MNAQQWEKLRKNWSELLDQKPDDLLPLLYQKSILTQHEYDHINNQQTSDHKKMKVLLGMLKKKPAQVNCFSELISALETCSPWLAEKITNTEATSDPSLTAAVDPSILDDEASMVLRKCFNSQTNSQTSLNDIRVCLKQHGVFKDYCEWNNKKLICFVKEEFVRVVYVKKTKLFTNLGINSSECSLQTFDCLSKKPVPYSDECGDTVAKCANRNPGGQKCIFKTNGFVSKEKFSRTLSVPPQTQRKPEPGIKRQYSLPTKSKAARCRINGRMLTPQNSCNKSFNGDKITNLVNSDVKMPYVKLLSFNSIVEPSDAYLLGHCLRLPCSSKHCKLKPIKNFLVPDLIEGSSIYSYVIAEILKFGGACLNDRQNGTIYFGVKTDKTDEGLVAEIVGVQLAKNKLVKTVNLALQNSFSFNLRKTVRETIRNLRFVPVLNKNGSLTDLFVVEFDVVPDAQIVGSHIFWIKSHLQNGRKQINNLYTFSQFGLPVPVQLKKLKKIHEIHMEARKREETEIAQSASLVSRCKKILIFSASFLIFLIFFFCYLFSLLNKV